jgi:alkylhydroperoxidase family enzyme
MAWIDVIPEEEADEELRALYERARDPATGVLDNILSIHSLHPRGLAAHLDLYRAVMAGSPGLPGVEREMIAVTVSRLNGCHY